ncbi:hypothetical protein [Spirosoma koreense]
MRQLVSGDVNLLLYERIDGRDVFLLEQQGKITPIHAKYPGSTLSQLPACPDPELTLLNKVSSVNSKKLTRYIVAYNRCIKPDLPTQAYNTSPRFLKLSIGARVLLPMSYYRIKFEDGLLYPASSASSKPSFGLSVNIRSRGRLGAGLDLGLLSRKGRWITDSTAIIVKLVERSLFINPFLRYEFRQHTHQVLTPYLTAGVVFNKILSGEVTINPIHDYPGSPQPVAINQETGLDEVGGSLGGGVQWQITPKLAFVADTRLLYTVSALSVFETPPLDGFMGPGARFTPRSYLLNCSVGINVNL